MWELVSGGLGFESQRSATSVWFVLRRGLSLNLSCLLKQDGKRICLMREGEMRRVFHTTPGLRLSASISSH